VHSQRQREHVAFKEVALEYELRIIYLERCLAQEEGKLRLLEQVCGLTVSVLCTKLQYTDVLNALLLHWRSSSILADSAVIADGS
jgi:hypothetical protein